MVHPTKTTGGDVSAKSINWQEQAEDWDLTDTLLGGTAAMRDKGTTYLPKEPSETNPSYVVRRDRSFLLGAYRDALNSITAKPFSRPVVIREEDGLVAASEQLGRIPGNVDREGSDLTQFARGLFKKGIHRGMSLILVEYPDKGLGPNGEAPSLAEERAKDLRPYFVLIDPIDVWGLKWKRDDGGSRRVVRVHIHETVTAPDGDWGEQHIDRVRVIYAPGEPTITMKPEGTAGHWELYESSGDDGGWAMTDSGVHTYPGIPLVPFYAEQTGFFKAQPALRDLAYKNLEHWQSSSDQRNILRFVRFAMLFATGITEDEKDKKLIVGPKSILRSTNEMAKFGFVEHSGAGVEAGRKDLADLQGQMEILGLQPLVEKSGNSTATGKVLDEGKKFASAQLWVRSLEAALYDAFKCAAIWVGKELPEEFGLDVHSEFALSANTGRDLDFLLKARVAGQIDQKTFLEETRRRGVLHELLDIDEIIEAVDEEKQENIAMMGELPVSEDDDDPPPDEGGE